MVASTTVTQLDDIERPSGAAAEKAQFGSDVVAQTLRDAGIDYVALNPGASFRGLHDSLVNFLGNRSPQILLCLHEESAVGLAHGYAKVTGRPMAAAVHSNVGLMHATMAVFNAWCDRMPVLVLGATGPVDASKRRPWIDWIHTAADQGALVRNYVKWDNQPASAAAAREAVLRGVWLSQNAPMGPVYINLDAEMQESGIDAELPSVDASRYLSTARSGVDQETVSEVWALIRKARRPVVLAGRVSRDEVSWHRRVALVEAMGAKVITDLKVAAAFPTSHDAYAGDLRGRNGAATLEVLKAADLVIALDWVDLNGTLTAAFGPAGPECTVIRVGLDHHSHNGWSMDHQAHPPADLVVSTDPDRFTALMIGSAKLCGTNAKPARACTPELSAQDGKQLTVEAIARTLLHFLGGRQSCLTHVTLSWDGSYWPFDHPLDYLGSDGGGGLGAGPAHAVGAALALRDMGADRLPVAICGDGDFLMGVTALWTAVHYKIPLLMIVANNRSFFNDEVHQEKVARMRGRDVSNKWIGMRMDDPEIALADMARAQGCAAFGPATTQAELESAITQAIAAVEEGRVAVVEVITDASYPATLVNALTGTTKG
ncbi:thiamine pyrophosphate-binding protein [Nitratireductor sp. B36]|uniref:thiamine pyrophosphate-binding protein n=1 Tax=Nitratireductor sp. B36 TaxID=2762059 RepID=UPI001E37D545|nr:thiamine pyrophosphate-binding protein [Nitratireductor sp. B36]MCC5778398.1 thiamine pyrophosphate-binding protein [Nitratireductor sp. B36]